MCKQVTPAQVREAEKSLKIMEVMIEAMTPGLSFFLPSNSVWYRLQLQRVEKC